MSFMTAEEMRSKHDEVRNIQRKALAENADTVIDFVLNSIHQSLETNEDEFLKFKLVKATAWTGAIFIDGQNYPLSNEGDVEGKSPSTQTDLGEMVVTTLESLGYKVSLDTNYLYVNWSEDNGI
jgi:hypothetical protein